MNIFRFATLTLALTLMGQAASAAMAQKPDLSGIKIERTLSKNHRLTAAPASRSNDVITEPAGTKVTYSRSSIAIAPIGDEPMETEDYGFAGVVVIGNNGDVYLKNPFSQFLTDSYLKGTFANGQITVEFPQHIMSLYDEEYGETFELYAYMLTLDYENEEIVPAEVQKMTLTESDGMWICEDEDILGLTFDDGEWTGFGEIGYCFQPIEAEPATVPDGISFEQWAMTYNGVGHFVDLAISGDKCYVKNIMPTTKGELAPAVGTISANGIEVASGQYLGVNEDLSYLTYLYGGKMKHYFDTDYNMEMEQFEQGGGLTFTPAADGSFVSENTAYLSSFTDLDNEYAWPMATYEKPVLRKNDIKTYQPAKPSVLNHVYYPAFNFGYAELFIPSLNVDGMLLDTDNLFYNFYMEGDVMTFIPDEYWLLEEDIVDMPYNFTDDPEGQGDIKVSGAVHTIMLFYNVESIGVQTLYKADNGEVFKSELATSTHSGVSDTNAGQAQIETITYTDLAGRAVTKPANGMYIRTVRYSDGTVTNHKEFRR